MKKSALEVSVGLFVLLGIAAVAFLALRLGSGGSVGSGSYSVEARFANSGGLHPGCSVSLAGVTVGRVEKVDLDPADFSAIVTMRLRRGLQLPGDSMASVKTSGLIGDKYVAISAGADEETLQPGSRMTLTESAVDLEGLISKMAFGSAEAKTADSSNP